MTKNQNPKIHYSDLYGLRKEKFDFLESHTIKNTKWQTLDLKEPYYFFVPKNFKLEEMYNKFISVDKIFDIYKSGVSTLRDHFVVGFNKQELTNRMNVFKSDLNDKDVSISLKIESTRDWDLHKARISFKDADYENFIYYYAYRPFDNRLICYEGSLYDRGCSRFELMKNFFKDNLGLILRRSSEKKWHHSFVTRNIMDMNFLEARTYVFPLYLYNQATKKEVFKGQKQLVLGVNQMELDESGNKVSNIKTEVLNLLKNNFNQKINPEEFFNYIYAILYSNRYRKKYNEFLKIDFPKIPITKGYELFKKISEIGENLIQLHLLKDKSLETGKAKFIGSGSDNTVRKREYSEKEKRIYINDTKYFEGIESEVWNYHIGGYQVLDKWLKDRTGKGLNREDVDHYITVIECLKQTIEIQRKADRLYLEVERDLIKS